MSGVTYRDAGVDIDAGERLVEGIKDLAAATHSPLVLGGLGGFAGLCALPGDIEEPVLVSGTDGVGTKLKIAFLLNKHDSIGIDLVAMCVNDVITTGAQPLFFLDYFATGKLDVEVSQQVIRGIAHGCKLAGCALLGGETAELPGFYENGAYDLAGFSVGVVSKPKILPGDRVRPGDVIVGLASTGLHSNGYSLARRVLLEGDNALPLDADVGGRALAGALLEPTRIYTDAAKLAVAADAHAMCHITGGGLPGNLPRVLPNTCAAAVRANSWERPALFQLIAERGPVAPDEMARTFNLGIGFTVILPPDNAAGLIEALAAIGQQAWQIGTVEEDSAEDFRFV